MKKLFNLGSMATKKDIVNILESSVSDMTLKIVVNQRTKELSGLTNFREIEILIDEKLIFGDVIIEYEVI